MSVRQKRKKNIRANISRRKRWSIFGMDSRQCVYCGQDGDTLDHVAPLSLVCDVWPMAAINHTANLVTACKACNYKRHRTRQTGDLYMSFGRFTMSPIQFHIYQKRVVDDLTPLARNWFTVASI